MFWSTAVITPDHCPCCLDNMTSPVQNIIVLHWLTINKRWNSGETTWQSFQIPSPRNSYISIVPWARVLLNSHCVSKQLCKWAYLCCCLAFMLLYFVESRKWFHTHLCTRLHDGQQAREGVVQLPLCKHFPQLGFAYCLYCILDLRSLD